MREFKKLDKEFQSEEVKYYYDILRKKRMSLITKKIFDKILALLLLILLSPIFFVLIVLIKLDSEGEIFYRQQRITTYGKEFKIFKFRTMVKNAEKLGTSVTLQDDKRITRVGKKIRKVRLDELPQLINILIGDMSFVGTRPEVKKYVDKYSPSMYATLLMPAGITSVASINYKDEDDEFTKYSSSKMTIDEIYIEKILPQKMKYNLEYLENFSFLEDIKIMIKTFIEVIR